MITLAQVLGDLLASIKQLETARASLGNAIDERAAISLGLANAGFHACVVGLSTIAELDSPVPYVLTEKGKGYPNGIETSSNPRTSKAPVSE